MRRLLAPVPIAALLAVAALVGLLAYGLSANKPDRGIDRALARGERDPAPALRLPELGGGGAGSLGGGGETSLASLRGKVVVINFWASWCDPCREESPLLERWHRRIARRGGTVLGVDVNDVTSKARAFVRQYRLSYPILKDRDGDSIQKFGVVAYPETFVIDKRGQIAANRRGPVDDRFMRERVLPLLGES
jgi:cytochrome c biogenesis protein CcmG, thiol:disulfide interchange protein DsbE